MFVLLMMSGKSPAELCCGGSGSAWGSHKAGESFWGLSGAFLSQFRSFPGVHRGVSFSEFVDRAVAFSELCLVGLSSAVCFSRVCAARPDTEGSN